MQLLGVRTCETRRVNDEQETRGSAALEPAALADPSAPRPQAAIPGCVNEEAAPASSLTQPGTRGQVNEEPAPASSLSLTERLLCLLYTSDAADE